MINLDESQLSCSRNVPSTRIDELVQLLGFKTIESFDRYLGLPTVVGRSKSQEFNFVKEESVRSLRGGRTRPCLVRGGRS